MSRAYREDAGGMERLSFELINKLSARDDIEATVVGYGGSRRWFPLYFTFMLPRILWLARGVDVVHLGDPLLADVGWLLKLLYKVKVAVMVHGLDVSFPNSLFTAYQRAFFTDFDLYLPISRHAKKLLEPWHVSGKVQVINPGVSDRFYDVEIRREHSDTAVSKNTTDMTVLLTVGRLVKRKGHEWFVRNVLPKLPSNTLYVIAGMGPELENISQAAVEAGVVDRIRMLGRVSDATLKTLYNTVDAFIQPNISVPGDAEGFGLVMLEAALCNRPVFASNIDGIADAIQDGANGHLLEAGNAAAWKAALESPVKAIDGQRGYTLERFGWSGAAKAHATALQSVERSAT